MENSYKFFNNKECKYMPCHKGIEADNINCLFCYCPMNAYKDCLGNPAYIQCSDGRTIKTCIGCTFPHKIENYDAVIEFLKRKE